MNNGDIPIHALNKFATEKGWDGFAANRGGMGDFDEPFITGVRPAIVPQPIGPANFPVTQNPGATPSVEVTNNLLRQILTELIKQNSPSRPVIRSIQIGAAFPANSGTLDWTVVGIMDRLMIRNAGPSNVWFSFDTNGEAVPTASTDQSFLLQANESISMTHCQFRKVGLALIAAVAAEATINAVGFQSISGNQAGSIL